MVPNPASLGGSCSGYLRVVIFVVLVITLVVVDVVVAMVARVVKIIGRGMLLVARRPLASRPGSQNQCRIFGEDILQQCSGTQLYSGGRGGACVCKGAQNKQASGKTKFKAILEAHVSQQYHRRQGEGVGGLSARGARRPAASTTRGEILYPYAPRVPTVIEYPLLISITYIQCSIV